jgi:hypothetical protein
MAPAGVRESKQKRMVRELALCFCATAFTQKRRSKSLRISLMPKNDDMKFEGTARDELFSSLCLLFLACTTLPAILTALLGG